MGGAGIAFGLSVLLAYGIWIEPYRVEVHHVRIRDAYLGRVLGAKTVVQLSDLHIREVGRRERLVLDRVNGLHPDIIFLTGDYVQWRGEYEGALRFLSLLKAENGIWAVMGDYDYSDSRKSCLFCHEKGNARPARGHSVRFLRNSCDTISLGGETLTVAGVDAEGDEYHSLPALKRERPSLVLSHSPLLFDLFDEQEQVTLLAGDTHGGQVPLPPWLFGVLGYEKNALYNQGLFEKGRKRMFVSRGIGTSHLPLRILRPPEVVVLHFTP